MTLKLRLWPDNEDMKGLIIGSWHDDNDPSVGCIVHIEHAICYRTPFGFILLFYP